MKLWEIIGLVQAILHYPIWFRCDMQRNYFPAPYFIFFYYGRPQTENLRAGGVVLYNNIALNRLDNGKII